MAPLLHAPLHQAALASAAAKMAGAGQLIAGTGVGTELGCGTATTIDRLK